MTNQLPWHKIASTISQLLKGLPLSEDYVNTVSLRNQQVRSNWEETYEFCLKADLAAALGTTKLRSIANEDADVAPTGCLEVEDMFSPGIRPARRSGEPRDRLLVSVCSRAPERG